MKWPLVKLGKYVVLDRKSINPDHLTEPTTYVGLENLDSDGQFLEPPVIQKGDVKSSKFRFDKRHILYGKLRPYLRKIARPNFSGICSTDILPLICSDEMDRDYVFHFLRKKEIVDLATSRCSGANLPRIKPDILMNFQIPKPPLIEQQKIASVLNKAYDIEINSKLSVKLRKELQESIFFEMFGDPLNPVKWETVPFVNAVKDSTRSQSKIPKKEYLEQGRLPIIDQGKKEIGGWTNDTSLACNIDLPNIIFGDHTKNLKFVDYSYALGADGVKVLIPKDERFNTLFLCHLLEFLPLPNVGYSRHYKFLKEFMLICPPKKLQIKYFNRVKLIMSMPDLTVMSGSYYSSISQEVLA